MKNVLVFAVLCVCAGIASGATVFSDEFNNSSNWVKAYGNTIETVSNGQFVVDDTGSTWSFYKHDCNYKTFTYTVKINALTPHNALGITFCWQPTTFEGYVFATWNSDSVKQYYSLLKLIREGGSSVTHPVLNGWHSFVSERENELKVSRNGSRIDLYCNGAFIDSVTDTSFSSGGAIGLVLGNGEKASFDYASVTDTYEPGSSLSYFEDNFDDGDTKGWRPYFGTAGTVGPVSGAYQIQAGTAEHNSMVITNGTYKNVPVKATVNRTGTDSHGFYGLILMKTVYDTDVVPPVSYYDAFVFKINGDKQYAAYYLSTKDSIKYSVFPANSAIHGTVDTLMITEDYKFSVNGFILPDIDFSTRNFDFNAVGFIADSQVTVLFDDFSAGDSTKIIPTVWKPKSLKPYYAEKDAYKLGGAGIIYDIRGRAISRYTGDYSNELRTMGAGRFIAIPEKRIGNKAVKAVITVQ